MSIKNNISTIDSGNSSWSELCKKSLGSLIAVALISGSLSSPVNAQTELTNKQLNQFQTEQFVTHNNYLNKASAKSLNTVLSNENLKPLFIGQINEFLRLDKSFNLLSIAISEGNKKEVENIINRNHFPNYINLDILKKDSNNLINQGKTDYNSVLKIIDNNIEYSIDNNMELIKSSPILNKIAYFITNNKPVPENLAKIHKPMIVSGKKANSLN